MQNYQGNERLAAYHRRAQTRGNGHANVETSKSPDKYTINKNLVVDLNNPVTKPVKRENSNTTQVTGITASTAGSAGNNAAVQAAKNNAFYNTQYKGQKGATFFPATGQPDISKGNSDKIKGRQQYMQTMVSPTAADKPSSVNSRFRSIQNQNSHVSQNKQQVAAQAAMMQNANINILHQN